MLDKMRAAWRFLRAWRDSACRACRYQYGILLAIPLVWGCLEAYVIPLAAPMGFLAMALFLERRPGRRLVAQALIYTLWSAWLAHHHPGLPDAGPGLRHEALGPAGRKKAGGPLRLEGRVQGFPGGDGRLSFTLATKVGRVRIMADDPGFPIAPGQALSISGEMVPPEAPTNPGQFDYPAYLRSLGIEAMVKAHSIERMGEPGPWNRMVAATRGALEAGLSLTVPAANRPLLEAALLGNTADLDPAIMDDFRASGMLHILAISGQHVGLLALILLQIFSLLRLPRKLAFLATGAMMALYVPVCGGSISVVRSAIMFWCMLPSILWERPSRGLNNLALAACLCLVWMPYQILSLGFQLSFGATFFLILYSGPISRSMASIRLPGPLQSLAGYAWPTAALSAIIFLGLLPILSASVHTLSPASIAGNLATVGLSSAMLVAGCLALLAAPAGIVGGCFGEAAGQLAGLLALAVKGLARLPGSCRSAEALPAPWSLLLILLLLAFPFAIRSGRARVLLLLGLAAFSGRWAWDSIREGWRAPAQAAFLDVGQGDATVLRMPEGVILVDAGPADAGRKVILPYLRAAGINRLDMVVITHPDLDHYGGLAYLAERMPIGRIIHTGDGADAKAWKDLEAVLARRGVPWERARQGQYLYRYGRIRLDILAPDGPGQFPGRNDNSLVCLLRMPGARLLLTGDMEKSSQAWLLAHAGREASGSILKVPHHGSERTTDMDFLRAMRPGVAVISAGRRNRFGHPGRETLETLRGLGSRLLMTPRDGAILYRNDGGAETWDTFLASGAPDRNM